MSKSKNPGVGKGGSTPVKHGHKRGNFVSPEYRTWLGIKRRCYDTKFKDYPNWGGRGIKVCEAWVSDFVSFLKDMGSRPFPDAQIDRIDPNGDYNPDNCRWVSIQQQGAENRRNIIPVKVGGLTFGSLSKACRHFGVGVTTANERIRRGVPVDQAVSTPGRLQRPRSRESYLRKAAR